MNSKTALITGGATGIGKKIAEELAQRGINLVVNYRSSENEAINLAKGLIAEYGIKIELIQADVASQQDCIKICEHIKQKNISIDILIHNAGPYIHERKRLTDYTFDEWNYLINGNLNAVFYLTKEILPNMREQKWGRVITIGFDRVETAPGWVFRSAFAAAKTGLASLTRTISLEEAKNGITANMVCPGDITGHWKETNISEATLQVISNIPVGRPGTGEDISRVVAFLIDEQSSFITGGIIPVTGGMDVLGKVHK
ncbi:SDR family oxidoreductase [Robertmurraya korlensis]|uniref:SDR family oxidoreductase n=1 Tax=Robertmurraya korlensis TaxID=519977 RepID=UPI000825934A|nr:SDR family oxidoreductase [Robertmurraya korlensis]